MELVKTGELRPQTSLDVDLYHRSGRLLRSAGQPLSASYIAALKQADVAEVCLCATDDDVWQVRQQAPKEEVPLETFAEGRPLPYDLFNKQGMLLLRGGRCISREHFGHLRDRGVTSTYRLSPEQQAESRQLLEALAADVVQMLDQKAEQSDGLRIEPAGEPMLNVVDPARTARTAAEQDRANRLIVETGEATDDVLARLAQGRSLHAQEITEHSRALLNGLVADKNLLIMLGSQHPSVESFIVSHTINVTLLAMAMGVQLGFGADQLAVLGRAALLHDVGMLGVRPELLYKQDPLTVADRLEIAQHPIRGLSILEQVSDYDAIQQFVVYQEHERENGGGYPKGRMGRWIADMARIIAVADTFEAMASPRPYREAKLPYESMAEVVRLGSSGRLHAPTVRALVSAVGLFPLGSLVKLSNGTIGRVVAVRPDRYDRPTVRRLRDEQGQVIGDDLVDLAAGSDEDVRVIQPVNPAHFNVGLAEGL